MLPSFSNITYVGSKIMTSEKFKPVNGRTDTIFDEDNGMFYDPHIIV
jgi:hypothetical protein